MVKPLLKSEAKAFIREFKPLALKVVENASHLDLDGDGKRQHAKDALVGELEQIGIKYKGKLINLLIEVAVNELFD